MSSFIVQLLAELPTPRLKARQAEVRAELNGIEKKKGELKDEDELISSALAARPNDVPPVRKPASKRKGGDTKRQRLDPGARGERREIYREILSNQSPTVAEIVAAIEARKIETNAHAVRAMLRRMERDGEAERVDNRHWKLASVNGSHRESPTEATSWGSGA
ncbi:MAG: hypothetical protein ACLPUT_18065 [Solirubrobacteraceae bacterium]